MVVFLEAFSGLIMEAMAAGLMFAKFSIPQARIVFSKYAVINKRNGVDTLSFRVANERGNHIVEAHTTVVLSINDLTQEGDRGRVLIDLAVVRNSTPVFVLSWSIFHPINQHSPLYNKTQDELERMRAMVFVSIVGIDSTSGQTVHTRHAYMINEIMRHHKFVDIVKHNSDDDAPFIDFSNFHNVEPC
jgi:inward rectifier potassium channel